MYTHFSRKLAVRKKRMEVSKTTTSVCVLIVGHFARTLHDLTHAESCRGASSGNVEGFVFL